MNGIIRAYTKEDKPALINLIQLNTPKYFHPSEEAELALYLEEDAENYFVLESDGKVLAAGGFNFFPEEALARISWDFVHPDQQGKGYGSAITKYRIERIKNHLPKVKTIMVRTSQIVYPFYEKMGFTLQSTTKDYWAEGFDLYQMVMEL